MLKTTRTSLQKIKCIKPYRLQQLRRRASPDIDTTVLYDYVDLYMKYICVHDAQQCLSSAILPPLQEQIKIVQDFNTIVHDLKSLHDLQGVILKLIITHDDKALATLTEEIQSYNNNIDMIRAIIEYANALPLSSNENVVNL
jgi:hypothetical protein